ncbi:MAG: hypothetical protein RLZZ535_3359 [Cyanobacteriota bacterium]
MTTIVKHRRTGNEYILLSINGETNKANPSRFISELFNQEKSEVSCSATVCDVQGNIFLAYIDDLVVTEINGIKPAEILPEATPEAVNDNSRSRSGGGASSPIPKGFVPQGLGASLRPAPGASVEVVQSPATEFDEEDFEDEDFEDEDELDLENSEPTVAKVSVDVVNSLDAPDRDRVNDDEDWI